MGKRHLYWRYCILLWKRHNSVPWASSPHIPRQPSPWWSDSDATFWTDKDCSFKWKSFPITSLTQLIIAYLHYQIFSIIFVYLYCMWIIMISHVGQSGRWPLSTFCPVRALTFVNLFGQWGCTISIASAIAIVLYYVYNSHHMIFMYLCYALKAGPMKDLASAMSVAVCPQGWAYEGFSLC